MDYEKAYKAVLQTATQWIKDGCTDKEKICLECVFPELRESEDERIARCIEVALTDVDEQRFKDFGTTLKDCIAYLEKQKEQKLHLTVSGKEVYKICPRCKERMVRDDSKVYTSMPPQYGYNCPKCGTMEFDTVMYDSPEMEEQKPAEWSKNDTVFLNEIIDFFENKTVKLQHDLDMYAHWLKSLPERFILQPKQEWSEEDEKMIDDLTDSLMRNLLFLVKQKMQKILYSIFLTRKLSLSSNPSVLLGNPARNRWRH